MKLRPSYHPMSRPMLWPAALPRRRGYSPLLVVIMFTVAVSIGSSGGWLAHGFSHQSHTPPQATPSLSLPSIPSTSPVPSLPVHVTSPALTPETRSLLYSTSSGQTIRWSCAAPITVALAGPAPDGADAELTNAVVTLAQLSGLPLHVKTGTTPNAPATITVEYVPDLPAKYTSQPDAVGLGGTTPYPSGDIHHGNVWIKSTSPRNIPGIPSARIVMLHELMHAIGIKHAPEGATEIMAPRLTSTTPSDPGPSDRVALKAAGCQHHP